MKKLALIFTLPFFFVACSDDSKPKKPKLDDGPRLQQACEAEGVFCVVNDKSEPLAGAQIMVGRALNDPFRGNFLETDSSGLAPLPKDWTDAQPVTVDVPGYVRVTHFARLPGKAVFKLRKKVQPPKLQLSGMTTDHTNLANGDGLVNFGLVISGLTRMDIMSFDINKVVSTQVDEISIIGFKMELPSNVTLPKQRESYTLPVTLEKPSYRLFFGGPETYRVFAAQGQFPLRKVVDNFRSKKKIYEIINDFSITGGVVRDVTMSGPTKADLSVRELSFKGRKKIKAPGLRGDEVMIALSLADLRGYVVPVDFKRATTGETVTLNTYTDAPALAVGVLKNAAEFEGGGKDRVSVTVLPFENTVRPEFLPLIENPRLKADGGLLLPKPTAPKDVNELATLAIYSDVQEVPMGSGTMPFLVNLWEVYAPEWVGEMNLPAWPGTTPQPRKKKWEVAYIGSNQLKEPADMGQAVIDAATHITHSSLDF